MKSHGLTVDNIAVSGTTAADWAKDRYALKNVVDRNPDAKYVWVTVGGNDARPLLQDNVPIEQIRE